jgi:hypothetical protein
VIAGEQLQPMKAMPDDATGSLGRVEENARPSPDIE